LVHETASLAPTGPLCAYVGEPVTVIVRELPDESARLPDASVVFQ
jgi:hypothetical protein